jgi:hypothetical protein
MLDLETFIDNAVEHLVDNLPAKLATIDLEKGDFVLPVPRDEDISAGGVTVYLRYPTIEVAAPDGVLENFSMGQGGSDHSFNVMVRAVNEINDWNTLYRTTMRYQRALGELLTEQDAFGRVEVVRMRWANRVNPQTEEHPELIMGTLLIFELKGPEVQP